MLVLSSIYDNTSTVFRSEKQFRQMIPSQSSKAVYGLQSSVQKNIKSTLMCFPGHQMMEPQSLFGYENEQVGGLRQKSKTTQAVSFWVETVIALYNPATVTIWLIVTNFIEKMCRKIVNQYQALYGRAIVWYSSMEALCVKILAYLARPELSSIFSHLSVKYVVLMIDFNATLVQCHCNSAFQTQVIYSILHRKNCEKL